eukprot:scaffold13393_cov66-Phaeocystis_antarctica.AAC.5
MRLRALAAQAAPACCRARGSSAARICARGHSQPSASLLSRLDVNPEDASPGARQDGRQDGAPWSGCSV